MKFVHGKNVIHGQLQRWVKRATLYMQAKNVLLRFWINFELNTTPGQDSKTLSLMPCKSKAFSDLLHPHIVSVENQRTSHYYNSEKSLEITIVAFSFVVSNFQDFTCKRKYKLVNLNSRPISSFMNT